MTHGATFIVAATPILQQSVVKSALKTALTFALMPSPRANVLIEDLLRAGASNVLMFRENVVVVSV